MRRTRFITLFFLVLAAAFFLVPEFRHALQAPFFLTFGGEPWEAFVRAGRLSESMLEEAARTAEQQRDARTLAFVALHGVERQAERAEKAVALDPKLTWVYFTLAGRHRKTPEAQKWRTQLSAWDSENALAYLEQGAQVFELRELDKLERTPQRLEELAKETEWRQFMEKGFAAPRYDSYARQRFELERTWLTEHGLANPARMVLYIATYPIPNLLNIRTYAILLVNKLGKEAESAGKVPEALAYYWTVARMGERMQLESVTLIEKLIGSALQIMSYEKLIPLLRKTGRADEAASVEYALRALRQYIDDTYRGKDPLAQSANHEWAVLIVNIFVALVVVFALLTVVCIVYVNAKRWVRPEKKGRLYQFLTVAENYMPIVLFFACLGLHISYYPYARNFQHYMTAAGVSHNFEPLIFNTMPAFGLLPGKMQLPLGNPFLPYAWYALVGVVVIAILSLVSRRKA